MNESESQCGGTLSNSNRLNDTELRLNCLHLAQQSYGDGMAPEPEKLLKAAQAFYEWLKPNLVGGAK